MKKIIIVLALGAFATGMAQETETKAETTTTVKTKVTTSEGEEVSTKKLKKSAKQTLKLAPTDIGKTNQEALRSAVKVKSNTSYSLDDNTFMLEEDAKGYIIIMERDGEMRKAGTVKAMGESGMYLLQMKNREAKGYFNAEGKFVVLSEANMSSKDKMKPKM